MTHDHSRERAIDTLTESQLSVLRLVRTGPSKVIAKKLGLSPHTVDNHLRAAMQRLGVATRFEAAQMLAEWEGASIPDSQRVPEYAGKSELTGGLVRKPASKTGSISLTEVLAAMRELVRKKTVGHER